MKILLVADIHGEIENLSKLIHGIKDDVDLIICPGDFTDIFNTPEGFSQLDIAELIIHKLLSLKKPVLCVPGNHDPYEIIDIFEEYGVNLHGCVKTFNNIDFVGFGGAETPFHTKFEPSESEIEDCFKKIEPNIKNRFVLVTHNPAFNTRFDEIPNNKHVGSKAIRSFIENKKPILAISAHIHERGGIDSLGDTKMFYPGPIFEGYYGIIEINENVNCEIKKVE
jgi:Icc-related predicted phosphoesterase